MTLTPAQQVVDAVNRVRRDFDAILESGGQGVLKKRELRAAIRIVDRHLDRLDPYGDMRRAITSAAIAEYNVTLRQCADGEAVPGE